MRVIFLDFDGVISTNRAWMANKHIDDFYLRWIDPIAVTLVYDLARSLDYKIVVSSTWRKFGLEACKLALGPAADLLHDDWRTLDLWERGDSSGCRPNELRDWLDRNGNPDYLIFDDDSFEWSDHQLDRWIKTDTLNGFSTENFETVLNVNEGHPNVNRVGIY